MWQPRVAEELLSEDAQGWSGTAESFSLGEETPTNIATGEPDQQVSRGVSREQEGIASSPGRAEVTCTPGGCCGESAEEKFAKGGVRTPAEAQYSCDHRAATVCSASLGETFTVPRGSGEGTD